MAEKRGIYRLLIDAAIFIAMEIAALNMLQHNGITQHFFLSKQKHAVMGGIWGIGRSVSEYFSLRETNDQLRLENFELLKALKAYQSEDDRHRMDSIVSNYTSVDGFRYMPASIVKISRNKQHNYLILGQGSEDGVVPQSAIITSQGVIGIVDTVSRHYSYAVSLMNSDLNISARIGGEQGSVGPLSWDGVSSNGAVLREIPLQCRFEPGDTVYTSGFSSIFPADIPLGIAGDSKIVNGATYDIKVRLLQGFNDVRYVVLATNIGKGEINELENKKGGR
ncbi:MAG: rod shape-determining protein MreC [Bacteroidales bacterium]|nr:rod shape-determining protein MreC [Bacteroidales bacterium]